VRPRGTVASEFSLFAAAGGAAHEGRVGAFGSFIIVFVVGVALVGGNIGGGIVVFFVVERVVRVVFGGVGAGLGYIRYGLEPRQWIW
jgi:hypothetical protein